MIYICNDRIWYFNYSSIKILKRNIDTVPESPELNSPLKRREMVTIPYG